MYVILSHSVDTFSLFCKSSTKIRTYCTFKDVSTPAVRDTPCPFDITVWCNAMSIHFSKFYFFSLRLSVTRNVQLHVVVLFLFFSYRKLQWLIRDHVITAKHNNQMCSKQFIIKLHSANQPVSHLHTPTTVHSRPIGFLFSQVNQFSECLTAN